METNGNGVIPLGDLIAAICDRASDDDSEPREVTRHAALATVRALLVSGNLGTLRRLTELEDALA